MANKSQMCFTAICWIKVDTFYQAAQIELVFVEEIKSVPVSKLICVERPSFKFRAADLSLYILSSVRPSTCLFNCPFIMFKYISWCGGYYHKDFAGNVLCQTQGGKLIQGLSHLIKQPEFQNLNTQGAVCSCLNKRNNTGERIYTCAELEVSEDMLANSPYGVIVSELLACSPLFTTIQLHVPGWRLVSALRSVKIKHSL